MLSCKEVTQKVSQAQDRKLTLRERIGVRLHLLICYACRRFVRQLAILTAASRHLLSDDISPDNATLTDSARQRIQEQLQSSVEKHSGPE